MARLDLSLPVVVALLLGVGLVTLNSAAPGNELSRQLVFLAGSVVLAGVVMWVGKVRLVRYTPHFYVLSIALLALVHLIGTEVNNAKSWLYLGPLPGFQPSEMAKLALILALASAMHERPIRGILDYLRLGVLIGPPVLLVFMEPDFGSALVIVMVGVGMVLVRGVPIRQLVVIVLAVGIATPTVLLPSLAGYQRDRLLSFLDPEADAQGTGYQIIQATIAVGSGGLLGKGYKQGTQGQLNFIPEKHTDFIFPVLAEEGGFVASVGLLLLYGLLFWRLVSMAGECPFERDQLIIIGVVVLIGFQVLVNIGVTLGLAPVTGITLPLVSAGGTSLISTLLALTVAFTVHRDRYAEW